MLLGKLDKLPLLTRNIERLMNHDLNDNIYDRYIPPFFEESYFNKLMYKYFTVNKGIRAPFTCHFSHYAHDDYEDKWFTDKNFIFDEYINKYNLNDIFIIKNYKHEIKLKKKNKNFL